MVTLRLKFKGMANMPLPDLFPKRVKLLLSGRLSNKRNCHPRVGH